MSDIEDPDPIEADASSDIGSPAPEDACTVIKTQFDINSKANKKTPWPKDKNERIKWSSKEREYAAGAEVSDTLPDLHDLVRSSL